MTNGPEWSGGCLCGKRRYRFGSAPSRAGYCHCTMCRRATGGPFAFLVRVEESDVEWRGERPAIYYSSPIASRGFCPDCGTPLFLSYRHDNLLRLTGGSLDHPERVTPSYHYGVESRLPYVDCGQGLPQEETKESW